MNDIKILEAITSTRMEIVDNILKNNVNEECFNTLKVCEIFQEESENNYFNYWLKKHVSRHEVSIQTSSAEDMGLEYFERTESKFVSSPDHLKRIIDEIERVKNPNPIKPVENQSKNKDCRVNTTRTVTNANKTTIKADSNTLVTPNDGKKRGPGRPKSVKPEEEVKDELMIKEELTEEQATMLRRDGKEKMFIETDNLLINDYYERYRNQKNHGRGNFKNMNQELERMIKDKVVCIPIFFNVYPGNMEYLKMVNKKPLSKTFSIDETLDQFKMYNVIVSFREWFSNNALKFFNRMEAKQLNKLLDDYTNVIEELLG